MTYAYGAQPLALRCGTSTWGFSHIKGVSPQGIITASAVGPVSTVAPAATMSPGYRTDCPVYQNI